MSCCSHCKATEAQFEKVARGNLARYRRRGPDTTTRLMLEQVRATGIRDARLVDIGAGIGALHHELLGQGASEAVHLEATQAYFALAQEEDERRGNKGRVTYLLGDAAEMEGDLPRGDLVTLDRVICCYPDWEKLVARSAASADRLVALSMPHDRWYIRAVIAADNLIRRLRGSAFRTFVHPVAGVERVLAQQGFRRRSVGGTLVWHVALYHLPQPAGPLTRRSDR